MKFQFIHNSGILPPVEAEFPSWKDAVLHLERNSNIHPNDLSVIPYSYYPNCARKFTIKEVT